MTIKAWLKGELIELDAAEGWTLLEILRAHELPVPTVCEGQGICGACHVVIDREWRDRLHPARDDERKLLTEVPGVAEGERLACQIIYDEALDGLALTIPISGDDMTSGTTGEPIRAVGEAAGYAVPVAQISSG